MDGIINDKRNNSNKQKNIVILQNEKYANLFQS